MVSVLVESEQVVPATRRSMGRTGMYSVYSYAHQLSAVRPACYLCPGTRVHRVRYDQRGAGSHNHDAVIKWKHCPRHWPFVRGIDRSPVNWPVTGEFPSQRPVTRSFDVFFDQRLKKRLSKQSWDWWLKTPPRSLWRHCNVWSERRWVTWRMSVRLANNVFFLID